MNPKWHIDDIETVRKKLNTDIENGLSRKAARLRLASEERGSPERYGSFFIREKRSAYKCFFQILRAPAALLLAVLAVALLFLGERSAGIISLALLLSGCVASGVLYLRAQRVTENMSLYSNPTVRVLREGKIYLTDCRNVVAGDIVEFEKGDFIPCDCRLIYSDSLEVEEYIKTEDGKIVKRRAKKNCDAVCVGDFPVTDAENAVLSGSFVTGGKGRAIAVGTGTHSYAYEFFRNGSLCAKNSDTRRVKEAGRVLNTVNVLCFAAVALFALISVFTVKDGDVKDVIFLALASVCAFTLVNPQTVGRVLCSSYCEKAADPSNGADMAVIKNNCAIDCFLNVTDIVLIGKAGITDGICHVGEIAVPETVMGMNVPDERIHSVLKYIYVYTEAEAGGNDSEFIRRGYASGFNGYMDKMRFDREKAELCLKSLYFMEDDYSYACAEWQDEFFRVCLTTDRSILSKCGFVRRGESVTAVSEKFLAAAYGYINEKRAAGKKIIYIVSEYDGEKILEGIADICEQVPQSNADSIVKLKNRGIDVTLLLGEESIENFNYVVSCGILGKDGMDAVARASDYRREKRDILDGAGKYRVFMGFEPEEYERLVSNMKSDGKTVVAYGVEDRYFYVYGKADMYVSCDNINYSSLKFKESVIENPSAEGIESSRRCSQRTRAYASVLVRRADSKGGGLSGIINAIAVSEFFERCFGYAMLCIAVIDIALLSLSAFSLLSGFLLITYPCVLLSAVVYIFSAVALFALFDPASDTSGDGGKKTDFLGLFKENPEFLVSPVCAALSLLVTVVVLYATGISEEPGAVVSGFLSLAVTFIFGASGIVKKCTGRKAAETVSVGKLKNESKKSSKRRSFSGNFLYTALIFVLIGWLVLITVAGFVLPSLSEEFGFGGIGLHTLIESAVYIAVLFISGVAIKKIVKRRNKK